MPNPFFRFKQFTIQQDKCAMKVGTDGTLLGAWADVSARKTVLDIGTGTGLIALMIAQRNHQSFIDAIDIDADAYIQSTENVANSPFSDRIRTHHCPLQKFTANAKKTYDLIVSNPPYFAKSLKGPETKRNLARHNDFLPWDELLACSRSLLAPNGRIALILPYAQKDELMQLAKEQNLYEVRQTCIIPTIGTPPKRLLTELALIPVFYTPDELILEKARNQRTEAYQKLTADFYL